MTEDMTESTDNNGAAILTVTEVADILRVSDHTVYRHIRNGLIFPCSPPEKRPIRIRRAQVEEFMENQIAAWRIIEERRKASASRMTGGRQKDLSGAGLL